MSQRISAFRASMVAPNLANRFVVTFNVLSIFRMRIYDTSLPTYKVKYASYFDNGNEVKVPVRYDNTGDWTFTVYEDEYLTFSKVLKAMWNIAEPVAIAGGVSDIVKSMPELSRENVKTAVRESYDLAHFTRIQRPLDISPYTAELILLDSASGTQPVRIVQLRDVTIESVSDIPLKADSTSPLGLEVRCHYNDLKDVL